MLLVLILDVGPHGEKEVISLGKYSYLWFLTRVDLPVSSGLLQLYNFFIAVDPVILNICELVSANEIIF